MDKTQGTGNKKRRAMWTHPWGYPEAFAIPIALLLLGVIWHYFLGVLPSSAFSFPFNIIGGTILLIASILLSLIRKKYRWARFLGGYRAAVGAMSVWFLLVVIMGLTRQIDPSAVEQHHLHGFVHRAGWSHMLHTRYFLLIYIYVLLCLGTATFNRLIYGWKRHSFIRQISFVCNHLGLYIALWAGLIGAPQIEKYQMLVKEESEYPEWRVTEQGKDGFKEMDFAIGLKKFEMEEYPPKLMVIDTLGRALPVGSPWHTSVEATPSSADYFAWHIQVLQHLPYAAPVLSNDSVHYVQFGSKGAVHAVKVKATHKNGKTVEGWISAGSYLMPPRGLPLTKNETLVMPELEAKQFRSHIYALAKNGEEAKATIAVNKPLAFHGWHIYQLNYDKEMGRWSDKSVFELVKDPWLPVVYIGIFMMIAGALCLFLIPQPRPRRNKKQ